MDIQSGFETIKAFDAWQLEPQSSNIKKRVFKIQKARPPTISAHRNEA